MHTVRRRRALLGAALALVVAYTAFAGAHPSLNGSGQPLTHHDPTSLAPVRWPAHGQAALVISHDRPAASRHEQPIPIASLAKVMTAYLTLKRYPLSDGDDGFTLTVTADQAQAEIEDAAQDQSVVAVRPGEQLTERQLLQALLIPSGNNIASLLARWDAGSQAAFAAKMNAPAGSLGLRSTRCADVSGADPATASTAAGPCPGRAR